MARVYLWEKLLNLASSLADGEGTLRERLEGAASDVALSSAFDELKRMEANGLDPGSEVSTRLRLVVQRLRGEGSARERIALLSDEECAETAKAIFELFTAEERRLGRHDDRRGLAWEDPLDPLRDKE